MVQRLETMLEYMRSALATGEARQAEDSLSSVANAQGASMRALSQYVLYNTTMQAAGSTLYGRGEMLAILRDKQLVWCRSEKG